MPAETPSLPNCQLPVLPPGRAYRFHTMVKPAGALCNLDCPYCFYLHKTELLGHTPNSRIDAELLEQHIRQYIEANTGDSVVFSWQGGEPTIMGLAFFELVVTLQRRHAKPGQRIENDLQTNGLLLDEAWVAFLKREGFHVGLSIDGPRELHNKYRPTKGGTPTFDKVMQAAALLRQADVPFAALCVVNRDVARAPREVYRFLVDEVGSWRIQFTPCVEPRVFKEQAPALIPAEQLPQLGSERARPGHPLSIVTDWSVDPEDYGQFLCEVWEEWLAQDFGCVHVNLFETAVAQSLGMPAQMCTSGPICGKALALEHDGSLYSCDHFVYPEYKLGNIREQHQGDLAFSPKQVRFGLAKSENLPAYCRRCPQLKLCWGECPKNRLLRTPDGEAGLNYLCSALMRFYARVQADMPALRQRLGR
nr:anaerobic sulfatase maturase [uncultured Roseateles sp.]